MDIYKLRRNFPRFVYHSYTLDETADQLRLSYHFEIPDLAEFKPSWVFPKTALASQDLDASLAERYAFNLGMVELISYWKCACPPLIEIRCAQLDEEQRVFWKQLYGSGLGEFRYRNGILISEAEFLDFTESSHSSTDQSLKAEPAEAVIAPRRALIPVGGGKDSLVSLERLSSMGDKRFAYSINATPAALASMQLAGIDPERQILPRRSLDPALLKLNAAGYMNGHTPFSALVAFSAAFAAFMYKIDDIVLSNESSANESTVKDSEVNHQYSKSSDFERMFAHYLQKYINPKQRYFSLLRPFSELAIARQFSRYPQYFQVFRSCNTGSKNNSWCGQCAKCLFVAVMLLPFLGREKVDEIIGREIFDDRSLSPILDELCGFSAEKPFECVGTVQEVLLALVMYINQELQAGHCFAPEFNELPALLKNFAQRAYRAEFGELHWNDSGRDLVLVTYDPHPLKKRFADHAVPEDYLPFLEGFLDSDQKAVD